MNPISISRTLIPMTLIAFGGCGMVILPADPDAAPEEEPRADASSAELEAPRVDANSPDAAPAIVDAAPMAAAPADALPAPVDAAPVNEPPPDGAQPPSVCGTDTGGYGMHVFGTSDADPEATVTIEGSIGAVIISGSNLITHSEQMPGLGVLGGSGLHLDPEETVRIDWSPDIHPGRVKWEPAVSLWHRTGLRNGDILGPTRGHSGNLYVSGDVRWMELWPDSESTRLTEVSYCQ